MEKTITINPLVKKSIYQWAVIGAGPAGIAAVGQLIEHGVVANSILWLDPQFAVGDFGQYWCHVSSNTIVQLFRDFLNKCQSFQYDKRPHAFTLDKLPANSTCQLSDMVKPLRFVTTQLQAQVNYILQTVLSIRLKGNAWHLMGLNQTIFSAKNIILATGAVPRSLPSTKNIHIISIYDAVDKAKLAQKINKKDRVAVVGTSHTAIMLLRDLLNLGVSEVINFYRQPLRFALPLDDWTLFDDSGLKGDTAIWARENINGEPPKALRRVICNEENIKEILPTCTKVIYAIGFKQRTPILTDYPNYKYNVYNGIIAPGLFGVGIGFPESKTDKYGNTELSVGVWKFISYLDKIMPLWLKYGV